MKWPVVKIGDLIEQIRGVTYSSGDAIETYKDGYVELLRANNISNDGVILFDDITYVPSNKVSDKQLLRNNDILIAASSGSISVVGKAASFNADRVATFGAFCKVLRPSAKVDARYLANYFQTSGYRKRISFLAAGANINNLRNEHIDNLDIVLPPLAEQKRIAALLDTADNIMRLREQAIAKLDELALSKFSEIEVNVKEHIELEKIVVKPKVESRLTSEKVWSLTLDQIESQTGKLIDKVFVDKNELGNSTFFFKPPVVLYSKLRPYLNKVYMPDSEGYATTELIPLYCNKDLVLPEYLALMLMSKKFVEYATVNSGGAKMPRMMMDKFWNYPVPLANMSVQQNIAQIFNQIKSEKKVMELDLQKLHNLNSSLQHQSFAVN